jgi:hypothetical protein
VRLKPRLGVPLHWGMRYDCSCEMLWQIAPSPHAVAARLPMVLLWSMVRQWETFL